MAASHSKSLRPGTRAYYADVIRKLENLSVIVGEQPNTDPKLLSQIEALLESIREGIEQGRLRPTLVRRTGWPRPS